MTPEEYEKELAQRMAQYHHAYEQEMRATDRYLAAEKAMQKWRDKKCEIGAEIADWKLATLPTVRN